MRVGDGRVRDRTRDLGVRTIVEIEFFDFVGVAMDQIVNQAAKLHYFTGGRLSVPLVIRTPIVSRLGTGPQHSQSLEAWFMHAWDQDRHALECAGCVRAHAERLRPQSRPFVENVRLYGRRGAVDLEADPIPFGSARGQAWFGRHGRRSRTWSMRRWLPRMRSPRGILIEVIATDEAPLDMDTILASLARTGKLVVCHDAHKTCGFGAELAARCMELGFDHLDAPVERVAGLDVPIPCGRELEHVYLSADSVAAAVERLLAGGSPG